MNLNSEKYLLAFQRVLLAQGSLCLQQVLSHPTDMCMNKNGLSREAFKVHAKYNTRVSEQLTGSPGAPGGPGAPVFPWKIKLENSVSQLAYLSLPPYDLLCPIT